MRRDGIMLQSTSSPSLHGFTAPLDSTAATAAPHGAEQMARHPVELLGLDSASSGTCPASHGTPSIAFERPQLDSERVAPRLERGRCTTACSCAAAVARPIATIARACAAGSVLLSLAGLLSVATTAGWQTVAPVEHLVHQPSQRV